MASTPLLLLVILKPNLWQNQYLVGIALALCARYLIGRNLFVLTQDSVYQQLLTLLLTINASILCWTLLG